MTPRSARHRQDGLRKNIPLGSPFARRHRGPRCGRLRLRVLPPVVWPAPPRVRASPPLSGQDQRREKRLRLSEGPPTYVHNKNYNQKCFHAIKKGIDRTGDYLGNYGSVQVYLIGQETDELKDPAITRAVIKSYCRRRNLDHPECISSCLEGKGASLIERARKGSTEAYLSYVADATSPFAELVFINPHGFPFPYLHTQGIHEYTHVFQRAFPAAPTWMPEGGVECLAFYSGDQHEWGDIKQRMNQSMRMVQSVKEGFRMNDFEDIEKVEKERPE